MRCGSSKLSMSDKSMSALRVLERKLGSGIGLSSWLELLNVSSDVVVSWNIFVERSKCFGASSCDSIGYCTSNSLKRNWARLEPRLRRLRTLTKCLCVHCIEKRIDLSASSVGTNTVDLFPGDCYLNLA